MLLSVLSGFLLAACLPVIGKQIKGNLSILLSALPVILFIYFLSFIPGVANGETYHFTYNWVPQLGINFDFHLDGLSLLFTLLITGIGSLVFIYTSAYLKGHVYLDRFYGYLAMFMSSMLGLVLSDNIITLFIFWELTSISSFFLIGFNNDSEASRKSSLLALGITGFGGLFLLAGMILLGYVTGSYSIVELMGQTELIHNHPYFVLILFLVFMGAFTKSAQFPFHFWLPGAMKAPTPVSTYLHSATMVKAGIYLLARFTPVLGNHEYWNTTLIIIGGVTMLYAAIHAVFRLDLKGILAYSTISALGVLVFLIGLGTDDALLAASVFILVHALYKATLFLVTGIIDHETGTRDVSQLSGLNKVMLPVGIAAILAAISNAGIPPSFGFLGKDLIYEATLHYGDWAIVLTVAAVLTNICLLFAGFLAGIKPFLGKLPQKYEKLHLPSPLMYVPPMILAGLGIVFGVLPMIIDSPLIKPVAAAILNTSPDFHLALWHGWSVVLLLSTITIGGGLGLYFILKPSEGLLAKATRFEPISPMSIILRCTRIFESTAKGVTNVLQNGYLRYYVISILTFLSVLLAYKIFKGIDLYVNFGKLTEITLYEAIVLAIMAVSIVFTVFTRSRLVAVAAMGIIGYSICLIFLFYSAPDLAMTQFSIDTLTVILFVLVLYNLPKYLKLSDTGSRVRDGMLALIFGGLISLLTLEVLNEPLEREISAYYAENAYTLAKGKNVVNVILVDFRGADTMVEIIVLSIAAIGVFSLLKLRLKSIEKE
ncbi:putative monovalent cation/H+ antiporter subunit A [Litoribacter alkaliphilus]|uniref:Monovalent cation/H+ antiporter subunit A n=1 Tax=Litoribacter ruber TaxID=702568 RepID=A0AAP2CMB8_9BACT|nr:putative monovalent cation/H+ antiporter subunit A [Litoribacter alkaliphilus]MBS9525195.1 putative monovalent cation/H+ antiporter subunit A [Litoribacter alkaliphilus]